MSRVVAVLRDDFAAGFALTGVTVLRVREPGSAAAREALRSALADRDNGLLVVEESLLKEADERLRAELERSNRPLVVSLPGALVWTDVESVGEDEYVAALVRRAVGYHLEVKV